MFGTTSPTASWVVVSSFFCQIGLLKIISLIKLLKSCSHMKMKGTKLKLLFMWHKWTPMCGSHICPQPESGHGTREEEGAEPGKGHHRGAEAQAPPPPRRVWPPGRVAATTVRAAWAHAQEPPCTVVGVGVEVRMEGDYGKKKMR